MCAADSPPRSFAEAWHRADRVQGWLTEAQGRLLFESARGVEAGKWIVEIGSHRGRSTVILAAAKRAGVEVLAIDPFDDPRWGGGPEALADFQATLRDAGLLDEVRTFRGVSADASRVWDGAPVGMLFVDGAHDRRSVLTDIDGWSRHLSSDAIVLFHDAFSAPGVTAAILERYLGRAGSEYLGATGSLVQLRQAPTTRIVQIGSAVRMLARLGWFARNIVVKIALRRRWTLVHRALGHRGPAYPY